VPNHDVTSVGTDIRALAGQRTAYEDGIFAALSAAGVGPDEEVMLVGHSEGGIVAVNAARDATRSGQFRVTHVVTAGSPIGKVVRTLPDSVQVLALENSADVVPHCDAADNPDRPNITTVTVDEQQYSIGGNHDLRESYEPAAADADASDNGSIRAFTDSAHGFLGGSPMQTHAYWITRGF
jgi:pimeloyl-ACP methyl ester carboxylesterase